MDIFYTSDTHSYVYPTDYLGEEPKPMGYMALASRFTPDSIIIDGGDVLQGSPLIRYELKNRISPHLAAKAFNAAGLDVFVPGNHDFDFGYDKLCEFIYSLDARTVCANLHDERGSLHVLPYVVIQRGEEKVLVTGAVTDYVNVWDKDRLAGMRVLDCVDSLKRVLEQTSRLDVDWRICVYHGGFSSFEEGRIRENRADEIAGLGFDVLLTAHQHQVIQPHFIEGTLVLQAGSKASCCAHVHLERNLFPKAEILKCEENVTLDSMVSLAREDRTQAKVEEYLKTRVGQVDGVLEDRSRVWSYLHGSSLADYINDLQLRLTGADISATSLFKNPISVGPDVTISDLLAAYPFANTLKVFEITASQLRKALERSAQFVDFKDGKYVESESFSPGKDERYNFDFYRGISYSFDPGRPAGERVTRLVFRGVDLLCNKEFRLRLVLNSYRASGTGGYDVYAGLKPIKEYNLELQDALIDSFDGQIVKVPKPTDFLIDA